MKAARAVAASLCEALWRMFCKTRPARLTETRLQGTSEQEQE